jgi:hypothetical protein
MLCFQSHWFIHSFTSLGVPSLGTLPQKKGKTNTHRRRSPTRTEGLEVRSHFPRGSFMTLLLLPRCHSAFGTIPSALAWIDQSLVSQHVSWYPSTRHLLHTSYHLPHDLGYRLPACVRSNPSQSALPTPLTISI